MLGFLVATLNISNWSESENISPRHHGTTTNAMDPDIVKLTFGNFKLMTTNFITSWDNLTSRTIKILSDIMA